MITFEKLKYKNFLSTGNSFTEISLNKHPTTLITGANGGGKSTILDAICFALYGKPYRKINKPNLLNSINKKNLEVEIEFSIANDKYKIRRGMKPNLFEIYKNGKMLNVSAAVKDYQSILEEQILKINFKTFCQIVIQGSASAIPFMQLSAQHRREVVEDLLDLEVFSIMNILLKEKISENNKQINDIEYKIDLTKERIKLQKEHSVAMKDSILEQIENKKEQIDDNQHNISKLQKLNDEISARIEQLNAKIAEVNGVDKKVKDLEKIRLQMSNKFSSIQKEIDFFHNNESCPTCSQVIDVEFKQQILTGKNTDHEKLNEGITTLDQKLQALYEKQKVIAEINEKITNYNMELFKNQNGIDSYNRHHRDLLQEIDNLQEKLKSHEQSTDISAIRDELTNYENEHKKLLDTKDNYVIVSYILKDKGIKSRIINQYIPVINKLINKYLSAMEFAASFHLDSNFNETIKSRYRDDFSYMSFSEGEKNRIDLAILLTWRAIAKMRNSASTNLLIIDEALESGLDANGVEYLISIIQSELSTTNTFLISHNDSIRDRLDNVIEFTKINNFSRIK